MLDTITINTLMQEYEDMKKSEQLLKKIGMETSNNSFKYVCNKVSNIVIQDVVTEFIDIIEKLESDKDKTSLALVLNQLYGKYGKL